MNEFTSINDILDFAIAGEQEAVDFYTKLAEQVENEAMKMSFVQFAKEEMGHKAKLLDVKKKGFFETSSEKIADLKIADYIVNAHPSENMTYQDALILAMSKEKAAFRLYSNLSDRAPSAEIRNLFQMLAQEESKHKLRFEIEYDEYVLKDN